ncbi:hypothetical protein EDC25_1471 [Pseudofulvimonas gallinarii]|uniref:Streptogrisin C n=2 Tax=Pseudofulvimonas gallinarii TaxID=634155 RepID=A0A4V2UUN6_9GAMM|nr:hypothetical protein EDC25_1471 [Pseudofulvimonas gallinarii]
MRASSILSAALAVQLSAFGSGYVQANDTPRAIDSATINAVMKLYEIDQASAKQRLESEARAAVNDFRIREAGLAGYAGSWFDPDTNSLKVATSAQEEFSRIQLLGGHPVLVARSLASLEAQRGQVVSIIGKALTERTVLSSHVDYIGNRVAIGVSADDVGPVSELLRDYEDSVSIHAVTELPPFSSGPVRGADGTRNNTWETNYGGSWICSVGVSVNQGFLTAGHCTYGKNEFPSGEVIHTRSDVPLGVAQNSTFDLSGPTDSGNPRDAAWVQTGTGWVPTAEINGYSSGTLDVPGAWSGVLEASINSTVCRYGGTSGGPYCGQVNAKNVSQCFGSWGACDTVGALTKVINGCTEDGDSGGVHLSASTGQVQGINVGGAPDCSAHPAVSGDVYFQPVTIGLGLMGRTMLTQHGSSAPTLDGPYCEGMGYSHFFCSTGYSSQGDTSVSWSWSGGGTSGTTANGTCPSDTWVTVLVTASNEYGSTNVNRSYFCRSGPPL